MKCPYRTKIIHKPAYTENHTKHFAEDIVEFEECYKTQCPFYYTLWVHRYVEHCRKAESEDKG